jgi:M6 family metalloprotease-like protein
MKRRPGQWLKTGATLGVLAGLWNSPAAAVSLVDFGHGNMKVEGVEARGIRPLVTILTEFDESPAFAHDRAYFDSLVYNPLQHSVNGYFITVSKGRFFWGRAGEGTIGPLRFTADEGRLPEPQRLIRMKEVAMESGFDFAEFDDNGDGKVTSDELGILFIDNLSEHGAAKRSTAPVQTGGSTVSLDADVASAGHRASLMTITHELSHLLGTVDLYGSSGLNQQLTLMGQTGFGGDDERLSFHLDPWHKMQLGWCEPRIRSLRPHGTELLPAANTVPADASVILYDPARGTGEYFMLEYRSANQPGLDYDENVADTGLVIWHVKQDGNKQLVTVPSLVNAGQLDMSLFAEGAPDFARGGNIAWRSGATTRTLRWLDGSSTGVRVRSRSFAPTDNSITVDWCGVPF